MEVTKVIHMAEAIHSWTQSTGSRPSTWCWDAKGRQYHSHPDEDAARNAARMRAWNPFPNISSRTVVNLRRIHAGHSHSDHRDVASMAFARKHRFDKRVILFPTFFSDCLFQSEKKCLETDSTLAWGPRSWRRLHQGASGTVCRRRPNTTSMAKFLGFTQPYSE